MIKFITEPGITPMSWANFCREKPGYSIAIDGYVAEAPRFNPRGPWANLNHHEGVDRLATRATCAQALLVVRQGLFLTFADDRNNPDATIYRNDCDEDVCLTSFILQNQPLAYSTMNPALNRLVFMEDMLDSTAGNYPFPRDLSTLQELMWVFRPYHAFRASGQLDRRNAGEFDDIITSVGLRIMAYIVGKAEKVELDTSYQKIGGGTGWTLVAETGANARLGVVNDGIGAFVSVRVRTDGRHVYSIGRTSQFVPFPLPKIMGALNRAENNPNDSWGGSNIIMGSPRVAGSMLNPDTVTRIIEQCCRSIRGAV